MNDTKKFQRGSFKLNPVAAAVALAVVAQLPAHVAQANSGYGVNVDVSGNTINVPTYFAGSPSGVHPAFDPVTHTYSTTLTVDTGTPIRKFVDKLGGVYNGLETLQSLSDLASGMPVAIPVHNWVNPFNGVTTKDDYYEIAVVEYTEQLHSDLPKATRLRGYVQIETPALAAGLKDITGVVGSEHIPATYPDGSAILDASGAQVYFAHRPHYLGPAILAQGGTPVRIKFTNYLPYTDATGKSVGSWNGTGGELPIPVDETIPGGGPVLDALGKPVLDPTGKPIKLGQNRVAIHWHGGDTPWSNDGTPHQWFAPRGDISYTLGIDARHPLGLGKGESTVANSVPDMADPGPGSYNLFFPNNLSGRLMMYHDHASGITRLNAYNGQAAGYIVYDPTELTLVANAIGASLAPVAAGVLPTGLLDAVGIPLVVQDKGFVPKNIGPAAVASDGVTPASQDSRWDLSHWGQPGDLFFPHVYETNQDPNSKDGTNPVGRWDWGPWFWPVFPAQYSLPTGVYGDVTTTPEAFMDTPLVNGQLYPTMTVYPKTYRFRMLGVGNDRAWNLGLYQAVDANGVVCDATNTALAANAIAPGGVLAPATCTEVRMVPAMPTAGFPATWPTDGRVGGVPDPATAGPDIVQIGNEAGLLPAPAVWKSQPISYEQNVRSITVFNVLDHDLLLAPAERADVLIDFSKYAGQTLIMYNDAPAPLPGFDPRIDYYSGDPDQTGAGGEYGTLPGYGPNTRTVMQFKVLGVNSSGTGGALNVAALTSALPVAYAASQPQPLIPESAYNTAFGTTSVDNYAKIGTGAAAAPFLLVNGATAYALTGVAMNYGGSGYPAATTVTFSAPPAPGVAATATGVTLDGNGAITGVTGFNPGSGYTARPTVSFSAPAAGGTVATAAVTATGYPVINKAIQELFDPVFGRMNATLAAELPFSTATVATTIPLAYIDTPIDYLDAIKDGETQIWKITHNGVDSHPVHFHLVNVQLINRVGWDGVVKPPAANELGWKETIRMNPLEDVYVAVRAVHPVTPFGLPTSERLLDPSQAVGGTLGFTNTDPITGAAPTTQTYLVGGISTAVPVGGIYSNQVTSFDNEYVWHCHILGHEEFDFMRPFIFHPNVQVPDAPAKVTVAGQTVTWLDPTPYGGQDAQGIPTAGVNAAYPTPTSSPKNELGFQVLSATNAVLATLPANSTTWTAPAAVSVVGASVVAYNAAGTSAPGTSATTTTATTTTTPPAPTTTPGTNAATGATIDATGLIVTLPLTATSPTMAVAGAAVDTTGLIVTVASTTGLLPGSVVSGGGFPAGTTIAAITSATTFTASLASATPLAVAQALTLQGPTIGMVVGASVSGGGFPQGTTIKSITSATTFTTTFASTTPSAVNVTLTISIAAAGALPTPAAAAAPAGLTQTTLASGAVTLTWTAVPGATSYTVSIFETTNAVPPAVLAPVVATVTPVTTALTGASIDATGKIVTVASTTGLAVGSLVSGGGLPGGTTITAITATTFTTSAASATPNATAQSLTVTPTVVTYTTGVLTTGSTFAFSVTATTLSGTTAAATSGLTNSPTLPPVAFAGAADAVGSASITLNWANNALNKNNVAGLMLTWTPAGGTAVSKTFAPTTTGATVIGLTPATSYTFSLQAISNVAAFNSTAVNLAAAIVAP